MTTTSQLVQSQIKVDSSILWVSDNGDVCCANHAGIYLYHAIQAKPRAKSHRTPLGTWDAYASNLLGGLPCSSCVDWMTLDLNEIGA